MPQKTEKMKHTEKLDLILRELYKFKFDGNYYLLEKIFEDGIILIDGNDEITKTAKRLEGDGFINATYTSDGCFVEINSFGVEYCESDSYTYKNHSIITNNYNLSITNSPNANIVSSSNEVQIIITNQAEIKNKIKEIKESLDLSEVENDLKLELKDCLSEIETCLEADKKPKFAFKQLLELGSDFAGISALILELGKLIFIK